MGGSIPTWLFERMTKLSLPITEAIIEEHGTQGFLTRISDPFWFQSFGAVIGMDWNSSGVTTAVMSALKKSIQPHSKQLGLYICGGKGNDSLKTPQELAYIADKTGLDGDYLQRTSRLTAKIDSTAIQDGYQVYLHYFLLNQNADWSVIQQGMHTKESKARRYHWNSDSIQSFTENPHSAICGENAGLILNLVDIKAKPTQESILRISKEHPDKISHELKTLEMPQYQKIQTKDVDLKRLGSILWLAQEMETQNFEELLLLKGLGPRTLQSLALVSEVIHGTPSRFSDPARFAFAHGGKGGTPFPVPTKVYDETIQTLHDAVLKSRVQQNDKMQALKKLHEISKKNELNFQSNSSIEPLIEKEIKDSWKHGGRTIEGYIKPDKEGEQDTRQ